MPDTRAVAARASAAVDGAPPPLTYAPPSGDLTVLYEDAHCLVLDKPAGLLAVPGKTPVLADCLESRAQARWPDALTVHRLDLATSGICIMARGKAAHRHLSMQFARRHVRKSYVALVRGSPWADSGHISLPLRADWPRRPRQMVDPAQGKPASTRWQVMTRGPAVSRLALMPLTGRSHQLRLHLRALGHPILGDPFYGGGEVEAARMMLHAATLGFRHPADGSHVTVEAPLPF